MHIENVNENCEFQNSLDGRTAGYSIEYRALAVIRYLFPTESLDKLIKFEHPDFIAPDKSIGLEITTLDVERLLLTSNEYDMYKHPVNNDYAKKHKKNLCRNGASVFIAPNDVEVFDYPLFTDNLLKTVFKERLQNKEHASYTSTEELNLALIYRNPVSINTLGDCKKWIEEALDANDTIFNELFVISCTGCLKYSTKNRTAIQKDLSVSEWKKLCIIGRKTAEETLSLDESYEWS